MSEDIPAPSLVCCRCGRRAYSTTADMCATCYNHVNASHLASVTDDQLRAECERRGFAPTTFKPIPIDLAIRLHAERDEWKRRAEAAEGDAKDLRAAIIAAGPAHAHAVVMAHPKNADRVSELKIEIEKLKRLSATAESYFSGIAAKSFAPDNSITHLDEDLLCDDA